jgi:hypothetical protein
MITLLQGKIWTCNSTRVWLYRYIYRFIIIHFQEIFLSFKICVYCTVYIMVIILTGDTVKKGSRFSRPLTGCHLPNSGQVEFGKWHPGWRRENQQPFLQWSFSYLAGNNSGRVWLLTSRLGTGKSLTFFYSVHCTILTPLIEKLETLRSKS